MIDIHCHILFGLDDGSKERNDSLEMAKQAAKEGIRTIIATPHHKNGHYENPKQVIMQKVDELNRFLKNEMIPVIILPGQEPRISGEMLEDYNKDEILTLNDQGKYLFVELPSASVPRYAEQMMYDLQMRGLIPIIVHPERNQEIVEHPEVLYQLVKKGALTQITAASVVGAFGTKIKKFSLQLIESNLTHFVASDAHNVTNRSFKMAAAFQEIEKKFGNEMVYLFKENAELLVQGNSVVKEIPTRVKNKKFLGLF